MPDQTTNKEVLNNDTAKSGDSSAIIQETTEDQNKKGKEKKMGFFAKWRASTTEAYEKHRAAGGNL